MVIEIKTDKPYEVIVEDGVLDRAGEKIAPLVRPSLPRRPSRNLHVLTDGYHLSGCTWGNGPAGPRKVARRTRNIKHDRRGERQMPDPGRQHRGRRAFRPQPNNSSY